MQQSCPSVNGYGMNLASVVVGMILAKDCKKRAIRKASKKDTGEYICKYHAKRPAGQKSCQLGGAKRIFLRMQKMCQLGLLQE